MRKTQIAGGQRADIREGFRVNRFQEAFPTQGAANAILYQMKHEIEDGKNRGFVERNKALFRDLPPR